MKPPDRSPPRRVTAVRLWGDSFGRVATRCVQTLAVLFLGAVVVYALVQLQLVIIPVIVALIFASALQPLMRWLRGLGVPSLLAAIMVLFSVFLLVGLMVVLVAWAIRSQWDELTDSVSEGLEKLQDFSSSLPFTIDAAQIDSWRDKAGQFLLSNSGSSALAGVSATVQFLAGFVLLIVVLFFFLKDGPDMWAFLLKPFHGAQYRRAQRIGDKVVYTLGGYARGAVIIAAVDAVGVGVGLLILQVPLAIPLTLLVFFTAFIPIMGAPIAGALAALVALVTNGPIVALVVIGIVFLVNQLEGNLLQPVVFSKVLRLHALVVLVALTVGTILGGVIGAVLSVPVAAVIWGVIKVWNADEEQPDTELHEQAG